VSQNKILNNLIIVARHLPIKNFIEKVFATEAYKSSVPFLILII
jgi:hypothetical protein